MWKKLNDEQTRMDKDSFQAVQGDLKCYGARLDSFGHRDGWMGGKMNGQKNWGFIWIDRQADGAVHWPPWWMDILTDNFNFNTKEFYVNLIRFRF